MLAYFTRCIFHVISKLAPFRLIVRDWRFLELSRFFSPRTRDAQILLYALISSLLLSQFQTVLRVAWSNLCCSKPWQYVVNPNYKASPSALLALLVCGLVSLRPMTSIGACDFAVATLSSSALLSFEGLTVLIWGLVRLLISMLAYPDCGYC